MTRALVSVLASMVLVGTACGGTNDPAPDAAGAGNVDAPPLAPVDAPPTSTPDASADAGAPIDVVAADAARGDLLADMGAGADAPAGADGAAAADAAPEATPADAGAPRLVTVTFTGKVVTVAGAPLGFDATVRESPVSGTFAYDLGTTDESPVDPKRGTYKHGATSVFTFTVKGRNVEGSGRAVVDIENFDPDTFRFKDGPMIDAIPRTMKIDGVAAPALTLSLALTDGSGVMLSSDALPDPFPAIDLAKTPHTFALRDDGGTLLMQLDSLAKR